MLTYHVIDKGPVMSRGDVLAQLQFVSLYSVLSFDGGFFFFLV